MGELRVPAPAWVVIGVLHADPEALAAARASLAAVLGPVREIGAERAFEWTAYYEQEMGRGLRRLFLVGDRFVSRELLPELKRWTNRIEDAHRRQDGTRRINLDPGLLSAENFVLGTTKGYSHRVYLRAGIYADVTLRFRAKGFEPFDWTYPDYRSEEVRAMLEGVRAEYLKRVQSSPLEILEELEP
jgi:hypothetical protein